MNRRRSLFQQPSPVVRRYVQLWVHRRLRPRLEASLRAYKGVASLQEAGLLDIRPLPALPRIEILGVFPTWEGLRAQL